MDTPFHLPPGAVFSCTSIPITLVKQQVSTPDGVCLFKCGFRIGGGIDQDFRQSPGFTDYGVYITGTLKWFCLSLSNTRVLCWMLSHCCCCHVVDVLCTEITPNGPAMMAGLQVGDKILQCNGYDFTIVTHKKAVEYIQRHETLNLLIARRDMNQ